MKTQNTNKLNYRKHTIVELNDEKMKEISAGSATTLVSAMIFSISVVAITLTITQTGNNEIV